MNRPLKNKFISQVKSQKGFDFEDFVKELYLLKYGSTDFTPLRQKRDKGCDGIIEVDKTIVACYGPESYDRNGFKKKASDDFALYQEHWETNYPNWKMVVNHELAPEQIKKVNDLKTGSKITGLSQIVSIIENDFNTHQRRQIAKHLNIDSDYFTQDYLSHILEDLLQETDMDDANVPYTRALYVPEKIELNYASADVHGAMNEFEEVSEQFLKIAALIGAYDDDEKRRIKVKVINDHNKCTGNFKEKLQAQTDEYLGKYANENDDDYLCSIRAVLLYHFEQCLIGQKTEAEK